MADWTPQSRAEEILFKTINGEPYDGLPQSRIEELLLELKEVIEEGGGGGGGTYTTTVLFTNGASGDTAFQLSSAYTNFDAIAIYYSHFDGQDQYEDVRIYPTTFLNSVSSTDEVLGFTNDAWYYYFSVYSTTEFRYVKSNAGYITDIIGIKYGSSSGGGGTDNYNLLKNLPQINGQTVKGNMSGTSLGLVNMVMGKDLSTNDYTNTDKAIVDSVTTDLADKVDKITGKGLSSNDYTNADKAIVDGVTSALAGKVDTSLVGSANGVAELDANGRVPSSQLPSYVDDVLEYADLAHFPATGETGKIYIAEDTNKTYRWSGSDYAEISESLALGETSSTAYAGNKGKANADAIAGIKNGTSINSFGAVETALDAKATATDVGDKTLLDTTDKSSLVAAINELVEKKIGIYNNPGFHNSLYRGKSLGTVVTQEQWDAISAGTFDDMFIGDYWTINNTVYRIADFDYFLRSGDTECTAHHAVIVPGVNMDNRKMNDTNVTTGAYVGSKMYTTYMATAKAKIKADFGSTHILAHREYLANAVANGKQSAGAWYDSEIELMTEQMVYGGSVFAPACDGSTVPALHTIGCKQLNLFRHRPDLISNRQTYWLRDVVSAAHFAAVAYGGNCDSGNASGERGVRPYFCIY